MGFTMKGKFKGSPVTVFWDKGKLIADDPLLTNILDTLFLLNDGTTISTGETLTTTYEEHLQSSTSAFLILAKAFDKIDFVIGKVEMPVGVVGGETSPKPT